MRICMYISIYFKRRKRNILYLGYSASVDFSRCRCFLSISPIFFLLYWMNCSCFFASYYCFYFGIFHVYTISIQYIYCIKYGIVAAPMKYWLCTQCTKYGFCCCWFSFLLNATIFFFWLTFHFIWARFFPSSFLLDFCWFSFVMIRIQFIFFFSACSYAYPK